MYKLVPAYAFRDLINEDKIRCSEAGIELYLLMIEDLEGAGDTCVVYDYGNDKFAWDDPTVLENLRVSVLEHYTKNVKDGKKLINTIDISAKGWEASIRVSKHAREKI